jgi:geranylgeranyl diphosphate synthase type II
MSNTSSLDKKVDYSGIEKILSFYRDATGEQIRKRLESLGKNTPLKEACEYALVEGKRFRPVIVQMVSKALGHQLDVWDAAIAVEFFHTASLIADDLPCMDNDDMRRSRPSLHKAFGESTALLASYALIAAGYGAIHDGAKKLQNSSHPQAAHSEKICMLALENASKNTGILGATGGQFLDLCPPNHSTELLLEVLDKKTVTLFEIAFVFGWLFGGGDIERLELVKAAAFHWGMAFQIADDLGDVIQDRQQNKAMNLAIALGVSEALSKFHEQIQLLNHSLDSLNIHSDEFKAMIEVLVGVAKTNAKEALDASVLHPSL